MSDALREYIDKHGLGDSKYKQTVVKSQRSEREIRMRLFDVAPTEEIGQYFDRIEHYYMDGHYHIWVETPHISVSELADWYGLTVYDTAVPQPWFDKYMIDMGEAPRAVWAYEWIDYKGEKQKSLFGEPVLVGEMLVDLVQAAFWQVEAELEAREQFAIAMGEEMG